MSKPHPIEQLIAVMAKLRDPDGGCPWDLEQDFKSILPYTLEEAYEVADAIDRNDMDELKEELGDLLLQPIYHAQMATEAGHFNIEQVIQSVTDKMIHRHPHVFGTQEGINTAEDLNKLWDERKAEEKKASTAQSALDGVAHALPALLRAQKLQKKAAKTGFEWRKADRILDKLEEELAELREAVATGTLEDKAEEFGDLVFVIANLGRLLGLNAEEALRQTNHKFERRFTGMEKDAKAQNLNLNDLSDEQWLELWQAQKAKEHKNTA